MYNRLLVMQAWNILISIVVWILIIIGVLYVPCWLAKDNAKVLYVATWADLIDPQILNLFYKKYGIRVVLNYFEDNYELVQKINATQGNEYDLVTPSDFALEQLIQRNLVKPLDKAQFNHWHKINPVTLSTYADPSNTYSIPYHWAIYGLGINLSIIHQPFSHNASLIFERPLDHKITMIGSARETILMALQHYYGSIANPSSSELEFVKQRLLEQKQWVEAYTEFRTDALLLSGAIGVGVITTPAFLRLSYSAAHLLFVLPNHGAFQIIDSWAIPKKSMREQEVYLLLNFLYESSIIKHHFNKYTFFPATQELYTLLDTTSQGKTISAFHSQTVIPLYFFQNTIQQQLLNDMWIDIKGL